jgi:type VI protein secretion system component VasK
MPSRISNMSPANSQDMLVTLNGPLITDVQATLARLSVAQRAYELLRSQAVGSEVPDWTLDRHAGPDASLVFATAQGGGLDTVRVPGFFTYEGFRRLFVERLPGIARQLRNNRWILGNAGEQTAVEAQYDALASELLGLYDKDFSAAWRDALSKLKLKRLTADKPKYVALAAASAATSPLKQLLESLRDETALTRERPGFGNKSNNDPNASLFGNRATAPGTEIEQQFKDYHVLVDGEATRRPIDLVVANLADINQSLLMAGVPSQAPQATAQLQTQVTSLRSNANRLPLPFAGMLQAAANDFDADLTNGFHAQLARSLRDQVTGICQQIVTNRYPFARTDREVPLADFGRLFAPQGVIDKFFTSQIAQYADITKRNWSWRRGHCGWTCTSPLHRDAEGISARRAIPRHVFYIRRPLPICDLDASTARDISKHRYQNGSEWHPDRQRAGQQCPNGRSMAGCRWRARRDHRDVRSRAAAGGDRALRPVVPVSPRRGRSSCRQRGQGYRQLHRWRARNSVSDRRGLGAESFYLAGFAGVPLS